MTMRLGILGYGDSGYSFAAAARVVDGVEPVIIGGRNVEKAGRVAEKFGMDAGTTEQMLAREDLDCVAVSTPAGIHAEGAIPFAERGVHLMVEKPMALTVEDCHRIIEAAEKNNVRLMVTQTHRYHTMARKAHALVESGEYGAPVSIVSESFHDYFTSKRSGWQLDHEMSGGGVLMNPFIHQIDQVRYLSLSEVKTAIGRIGRHKEGYDIEGNVECFVTLENGCTGFVHVNGYGYLNFMRSVVCLERGALVLDLTHKRLEVWTEGRRIRETLGVGTLKREKDGVIAHEGYCAHLEEMRDAIEHGGPITSDGHNGLRNVEIAQAILRGEQIG